MIIPKVKSLFSPDLDRPNLPADPENCQVFCEATIGPHDSHGEEIFSFTVVTPSSLTVEERFRWGRSLLIVPRFSWELVDLALSRLLMHAARSTWREVAEELNKCLGWEFENYRETRQPPDRSLGDQRYYNENE